MFRTWPRASSVHDNDLVTSLYTYYTDHATSGSTRGTVLSASSRRPPPFQQQLCACSSGWLSGEEFCWCWLEGRPYGGIANIRLDELLQRQEAKDMAQAPGV